MSGRPREGAAGDLNTVRVSRVVGLLCGRPREGAAGDLNVVIDAPRVFVVVLISGCSGGGCSGCAGGR